MIALALGGRSVAEWQATMTRPEYLMWVQFYKLYPFDDFHRIHRPAALIAQSMGGGEIQPRLDWLQPDPRNDGMSEADRNTLRAFGYRGKVT